MKKVFLFAILSLFSYSAFSQTLFKKGYFIDNKGNQIDCLIKDADKIQNPSEFTYKLSENSEIRTATIETVQEFEIYNTPHKYRRFTVQIDKSGTQKSNLTQYPEPDFQEETLFLRVLLEGQATLYRYFGGNGMRRFFIQTNNTQPEQLIYKEYTINGEINQNTAYRKQLFDELTCGKLLERIRRVNYKEKQLTSLFEQYNRCVNAEFENYSEKQSKDKFNFTIKAGANSSTPVIDQNFSIIRSSNGMVIERRILNYTATLDEVISPEIGLEIEVVFAFNNQKWSAYLEPTFQYFRSTQDFTIYTRSWAPSNYNYFGTMGETGTITLNYSHIILPLGVRHSFFLNENSKIYVNGAVAYNFLVNASRAIDAEGYSVASPNFEHETVGITPSFIAGAGYKYNRLSIEASYQFSKAMLDQTTAGTTNSWKSRLQNSFSLRVGYQIF